MTKEKNCVDQSPLGKKISPIESYDPELLFPVPRKTKRQEIHVHEPLPFHGVDIWNAFEISWLYPGGKPEVALAKITIPCTSPYLIESKSLKLYLNSLNQSKFESIREVQKLLIKDLSSTAQSSVSVELQLLKNVTDHTLDCLPGLCLDNLKINTDTYQVATHFLKTSSKEASEVLFSNLLKSNCLITGQADWASLQISYHGPQIDHEGLLKYIISFRNHHEFHEQCIERIFMDLLLNCQPQKLSVYGRYTRRGGLDINPFRSNFETAPANPRLPRQ